MATEDDSDIPESGAVFTFGKSKFADNLPNKFWVRNDRVRDVACGDEHTALVAESGRVFTFGSNEWGQLGLGTTKTADRPSCIKSLKSEKVLLVACGRTHTIVATELGKLYSFGANGEGQLGVEDSPASNVPKCIDSLVTQQYSMLAAGADHSVALTEDGAVFVWGGGSEGQLGLGGKTECPDPEEIPIDDVVTCISCGYYHTAMVTETGELYTFGESEAGKLGLGDDPDDTHIPQKVDIPEPVTAVACGGNHTVVLAKSGNVYTFGEGPNGQLGHGTQCLQISTPRKIPLKYKVRFVACGENHTSLISDKGQLYTFGDGRHGKLAIGQDSYSNIYTPLKAKRFAKFDVEKVSCGGCHMICLAKPQLENGHMSSSEDETLMEPKLNGMLNHSLRPDGSIDLNNSVTARDRRRKHNDSFKNDLNRTLPSLAGAYNTNNNNGTEHLHQTVPAIKSRRLQPTPPSKLAAGDTRHSDQEQEVHEEVMQRTSVEEVKSSPKSVPRPQPRRQPEPPPAKHSDSEEEDSESGEVEEEIKETRRALPLAPIPVPRLQAKLERDTDSEAEDDHKTKHKDKQKKKGKKKKTKKKSMDIFGPRRTGISDEENEDSLADPDEHSEHEKSEDENSAVEDESVQKLKSGKGGAHSDEEIKPDSAEEAPEVSEDEEDDVKDKKSKKKDKDKKKDRKKDKGKKDKKKKKGKEDDEEDKSAAEDDEGEEEETKDKKKDKKKDKGKKDKKKKGKKDEDSADEEEDKQGSDEEETDKKSKKKDNKKDKKKDKGKDKKGKKGDGDSEEEDADKSADENDNTDDKKDEDKDGKKDEKPAEPPKKKSRTCTIL